MQYLQVRQKIKKIMEMMQFDPGCGSYLSISGPGFLDLNCSCALFWSREFCLLRLFFEPRWSLLGRLAGGLRRRRRKERMVAISGPRERRSCLLLWVVVLDREICCVTRRWYTITMDCSGLFRTCEQNSDLLLQQLCWMRSCCTGHALLLSCAVFQANPLRSFFA